MSPASESHLRTFLQTRPRPCPYLAGRTERNLVTILAPRNNSRLFDTLSVAGFRRSHGLLYRPVCDACQACVPVRILADHFQPSRTMRRMMARNSDLTVGIEPAVATPEQFDLFRRYQHTRHGDSEMARMDFKDYRAMEEDSPGETLMVTLRGDDRTLVAVGLTDRIADGLSAVYSFFDPRQARRSLGSQVIVNLIDLAQQEGRPHVYLGYWIAASAKMAYKSRYRPLEALTRHGWRPFDEAALNQPMSGPRDERDLAAATESSLEIGPR
ncbi:MAG: arginyltransferase [Alphaproteobacteria bacterium]